MTAAEVLALLEFMVLAIIIVFISGAGLAWQIYKAGK